MNKKAFSLIELSIVILIIGILVAGVTQGSRLISQFRLQNARNLTQGAPVTSIKDLEIWYEASSEKSFDEEDQEDESAVTNWYDINPQSTSKINAAAPNADAEPLYVADCINSIPCLRFDGTDDTMPFDGSFIAGSNYTIFIVERRRGGVDISLMLGGSGTTQNTNLNIGYRSSTAITQDHLSNGYDVTVTAFAANIFIPRVHAFSFNRNATTDIESKTHILNGANSIEVARATNDTTALLSWAGSNIGRYVPANSYYNGDIAEIIMFSRHLKIAEKNEIITYLGKKYGVSIL
jgi:prepilin-type N-terminal cleavage/methylation domain-containing protein